jgi:hypothetical protein
MKIIMAIVVLGCFTALGQTNIITFTNTDGTFITNAAAVKIAPNKLLYRTANGGGTIELAVMPKPIQDEFNYNATNAAAADANDKERRNPSTPKPEAPLMTFEQYQKILFQREQLMKTMPIEEQINYTQTNATTAFACGILWNDIQTDFGKQQRDLFWDEMNRQYQIQEKERDEEDSNIDKVIEDNK